MDDLLEKAKGWLEQYEAWNRGVSPPIRPPIHVSTDRDFADLCRALLAAYERIKAQAECIERLRGFARIVDHWNKEPIGVVRDAIWEDLLRHRKFVMKPGDMGDPSK